MDDSGFRYFWNTREGELKDDQIPDDYEIEDVDDPLQQGRYRCCHALIDRRRPDSLKVVKILEQKLFHQRSYIPSGQPVPEYEETLCRCSILNFIESLLRDTRNINRTKFVIAATFGVKRSDGHEDEEVEEEELELEDEEVEEEEDEDTMEVEENELGFVPASKSEKISGVGSGECAICLGENSSEQKKAKRMPCGHVYHADCIMRWLVKSHLCPLCHCAMPIDW